MSLSVTGGIQLGDIPGNTEMYTASQTISKIAALQTILSGLTDDGWASLDNIVSGIDSVTSTFATKAALAELSGELNARVVPECGILTLASGVNSGLGVAGVYYLKGYENGNTALTQLLDDKMFDMSGDEIINTVNEAARFLHTFPSSGEEAARRISGLMDAMSGAGLTDGDGNLNSGGYALSGLLDPNSSDMCNMVHDCIDSDLSGLYLYFSGLICGHEDRITVLEGFMSDYCGMTNCCDQISGSVGDLASILRSLQNAVYSLSGAVSGMYDEIGEAIVDALTSSELSARMQDMPEDDERRVKIEKARNTAIADPAPGPVPGPPQPKPNLKDIVKPKIDENLKPVINDDVIPPLEDISEILDNPETQESDSVKEIIQDIEGDDSMSGGESGYEGGEEGGDESGEEIEDGDPADVAAEKASDTAGKVATSFAGGFE